MNHLVDTIKKILTYRIHIRVYRLRRVPLWFVLLVVVLSSLFWWHRERKTETKENEIFKKAMVAEGINTDAVRVTGKVTDFRHEKKKNRNYFIIKMRWQDLSGKTHNGVSKFHSTILEPSDLNLKIDQEVTLTLNPTVPNTAYILMRKDNKPIEIIWRE